MTETIDNVAGSTQASDAAAEHSGGLSREERATDSVEALKVHRIEAERPRKHLHVMGTSAALSANDETPPSELAGVDAGNVEMSSEGLHAALVAAMKTVYDPEIPVDIYQLGLIYDIAIDEERNVVVRMTLTAPGCPVAGSLVGEVARKSAEVPGVKHAKVDLVFDPPWTMDKMSDEAKLELGLL